MATTAIRFGAIEPPQSGPSPDATVTPAVVVAVAAVAVGAATNTSAVTHPALVSGGAGVPAVTAGQITFGTPVIETPAQVVAAAAVPQGSMVVVDDIVSPASVSAVTGVGATLIHSTFGQPLAVPTVGVLTNVLAVSKKMSASATGTASMSRLTIPHGGITTPRVLTATGTATATIAANPRWARSLNASSAVTPRITREVDKALSATANRTVSIVRRVGKVIARGTLNTVTLAPVRQVAPSAPVSGVRTNGTLGPVSVRGVTVGGTLVLVPVHYANSSGGLT